MEMFWSAQSAHHFQHCEVTRARRAPDLLVQLGPTSGTQARIGSREQRITLGTLGMVLQYGSLPEGLVNGGTSQAGPVPGPKDFFAPLEPQNVLASKELI